MSDFEILVTDPISEQGLSALAGRNGFRVRREIGAKGEALAEALKTAHAWLVRSESKVDEASLAKAPNLKLVGRAGVGTDNIDMAAASRRGVLVVNVPGGNTLAAAEHAWAMLLALSRNIPQADAELRAGRWERSKWVGSEVAGKTLGVVGLGRIGREVVRRAHAFQMTVLGFDPYLSQDQARVIGVEKADLETLLAKSDYITLHAALTDKTRALIDEKALSLMKKDARLVNCARGELVDEAALARALHDGRLKGAALDVFSKEPLPADSPLRGAPRLVMTPHLGASTEEAQLKVARELADCVVAYFEQGAARNAVNLPDFDAEVLEQTGAYLELAERLGKFAAQIVQGGLQTVKVHLAGPFSANQKRPIAVAALKGLLASILDEPGISWVNAPLVAQERGIRILESSEDTTVPGPAGQVTVEVLTEAGTGSVTGTVLPHGESRLTRLGPLSVDVVLAGKLLVLRNTDTPGMIGEVGRILGAAKVNIADMRVGRISKLGEAAMVITVDETVSDAVRGELAALKGIREVHWVEL